MDEAAQAVSLPFHPNLVVMDTDVVAHAPARLLVSGMGDALATWFEAKSCYVTKAGNMPGGAATEAAMIQDSANARSSDKLVKVESFLCEVAEGIVKLAIKLTENLTLIGRAGTDSALDLFYTLNWGEPPKRTRNRPQTGAADSAGSD